MNNISLPNETLNAIFDYLSPHALTQIVRVSHRFHAVGERILYSNVLITESVPRSSPVPYHTLHCCQTLLRRFHLSESVRKFCVRWQTESAGSPPRDFYMPYIEPVLKAMNETLRRLHSLEHLDLALGLSGGPTISSRGILNGCRFPALRLFSLSGVGRGSLSIKSYQQQQYHHHHPHLHQHNLLAAEPPPPLMDISWFLSATPSIQHLRLPDFHEPLTLRHTDLPFLSSFRGSAPTAASVLPGRAVQLLALVGHEFVTESDLEKMAMGSVRIRWLDLSGMSVTPILLRDISRHLFGVEFLKLKLALRHTLHHALSGISILAGLTSVLGAFPDLHHLDLSPTQIAGEQPVIRYPGSNVESSTSTSAHHHQLQQQQLQQYASPNAQLLAEEAQLCRTWGRGCPSLRHVVFPSRTEWVLDTSSGMVRSWHVLTVGNLSAY